MKVEQQQKMYDALKLITRGFQTSEQAMRDAHRMGLDPTEGLEMAYDNMQFTARAAIKGLRRPKTLTKNI